MCPACTVPRDCISVCLTLYDVPLRVFHYSCMGTMYFLPSTSIVVCMPQQRCHNLSSCSCGADPSAVWLLTLFFFDLAGLLNHWCSWSVYIMCWCVPLFYTILSCCRSKNYCYIDIGAMQWRWDPSSLPSETP